MKATIETIAAINVDYDQLATDTGLTRLGGSLVGSRAVIAGAFDKNDNDIYAITWQPAEVTEFADTAADVLALLDRHGLTDAEWTAEDADL